MICKLCKEEKKPKSNTHYLTDFIIKTALNEGGSKYRGRGLYWEIDPTTPIIKFKYQQNTSTPKLEELLGRKTTDQENKDAKENIDFAVSDSFCTSCEDLFTEIENEFADRIIQKFRGKDLHGIYEVKLSKKNSQLFRLFFLMQFWRTSECDSTFTMSPGLSEFLRKKIFEKDRTGLEDIPLSVTYLQTTKDDNDDEGEKYKTENIVAPVEGSDPFIIIMNDFVLQLYEDLSFPFESFYGYYEKSNYKKYLNYKDEEFVIKIISNELRRKIGFKINEKAGSKFMPQQAWLFLDKFTANYKRMPTNQQIGGYLKKLTDSDDLMKFTDEKLNLILSEYIENIFN